MLDGDVLVIIGSSSLRNAKGTMSVYMTSVHTYDVSDRTNPILKRVVEVEGNYLTARLLDKHVYVVISTYPRYNYAYDEKDGSSVSSLSTTAPLSRTLTPAQADIGSGIIIKLQKTLKFYLQERKLLKCCPFLL